MTSKVAGTHYHGSKLMAQVNVLRGKARRLYFSRAAMIWLSVVMLVGFTLLLVDIGLRREETGLRILFLVFWLLTALGAAAYWLRPAWCFAPTSLELAAWIERAQPEIGNRLTSAIQLADLPNDSDSLRFGSTQFREAVLNDWSAVSNQVDWRAYIKRRSWFQAGLLLVIALCVISAATVYRPDDFRLAAARLFAPWSKLPWPTVDQLQFSNLPTTVAAGQQLQLEIIDLSPPLPSDIELLVRATGDNQVPIAIACKNIGEVAVATLPDIEHSIEVRAVGGDDQRMRWHIINVVTPPRLSKYRFIVEPPEYTRRTTEELVGNRIQVLAGSRVTFRGTFAEPIQSVAVRANHSADTQTRQPMPGELEASGLSFQAAICDSNTVEGTLSFHFQVAASEDVVLQLPDVWNVDIVADKTPQVVLQSPDLNQLAPGGTLQIAGIANDDLGLTKCQLKWQVDNATAQIQELMLWESDEQSQRDLTINYTWTPTNEVTVPGNRITVWLEASDSSGQVGKSPPWSFDIRNSNDVLETIVRKQNELLEQIRNAAESERRNEQLVERTEQIIDQTQKVRQEELDALRNGVQMQLAINRQVSGEQQSIAATLQAISQQLRQNQLQESDTAQEIEQLIERIEAIHTETLQPATGELQSALTAASKSAEKGALSSSLMDALAKSKERLATASDKIAEIAEQLSQKETLRDVERELQQISSQQKTLRQETDSLEIRRLSGLSPAEFQAARAGLQSDQQGLARRLDELLKKSNRLAQEIGDDPNSLKIQLEKLTDGLIEHQVSGQMRTTAEQIASDRFADASDQQQQIISAIDRALQHLGSASPRTLAGKMQSLKPTSEQLNQLAAAQGDLANRLAQPDATQNFEELRNTQQRIQKDTSEQRTQREQNGDLSLANQLKQAEEFQQQAAGAEQPQQAELAARQAAQALADAADESEQRLEELQAAAAEQQLQQLAASLSQLIQQQRPLVDRLTQAAQHSNVELADDQRTEFEKDLRNIASRQEAVRQMLRDIKIEAELLPAFLWALDYAENDMNRAILATQRYRISPDAVEAATRALRKLEQAASSLEQTAPQPNTEPAQPQNDSSNQQSEKKSSHTPPIASLKLLRDLQQEINNETQLLSKSAPTMDARSQRQRLDQLAADQQELGKLMEVLLREVQAATEDNK